MNKLTPIDSLNHTRRINIQLSRWSTIEFILNSKLIKNQTIKVKCLIWNYKKSGYVWAVYSLFLSVSPFVCNSVLALCFNTLQLVFSSAVYSMVKSFECVNNSGAQFVLKQIFYYFDENADNTFNV